MPLNGVLALMPPFDVWLDKKRWARNQPTKLRCLAITEERKDYSDYLQKLAGRRKTIGPPVSTGVMELGNVSNL